MYAFIYLFIYFFAGFYNLILRDLVISVSLFNVHVKRSEANAVSNDYKNNHTIS